MSDAPNLSWRTCRSPPSDPTCRVASSLRLWSTISCARPTTRLLVIAGRFGIRAGRMMRHDRLPAAQVGSATRALPGEHARHRVIDADLAAGHCSPLDQSAGLASRTRLLLTAGFQPQGGKII